MTIKDDSKSNSEAVDLARGRLNVEVGALVQKDETIYRVAAVLDFESVIGTAVETGRPTSLLIRDLQLVASTREISLSSGVEIEDIQDGDWKIMQKRLKAIRPLVDTGTPGREAVCMRAKEIGVHPATMYRWMQRYNALLIPAMLIPQKRGWTLGKSRIPASEAIVAKVIKDSFLTKQRIRKQKVVKNVLLKCDELGIKAPSASAIRARISAVSEYDQLRARGFGERASNRFHPVPGKFPGADFPLAVIQIDHTPIDLILVDDVHRQPIGRPWLTLAIEVLSRMIAGYYLSFDSPSVTSVAMCLAHSILPKEEWLLAHGIDADWPVWGFPAKVHFDNGPDFRSGDIQRSCLQHNIQIDHRPVKVPRYGGHIERLLGTFAQQIHEIPGTTFSSIKHREGYDSDKYAVMTKSELEVWLIRQICHIYHKERHSTLGMTPARKWEIGIFGNGNDVKGIGLPARPVDGWTIQCDFLPTYFRTVQTTGIQIDIDYYAEPLRAFINAIDPDTGKKKKFIFRRDPRDISVVWFFDPVLKQYFKIPAADQSFPVMSIWEYRNARAKLKEEGKASADPREVMRAVRAQREHIDASAQKTKKARKAAQRRREHEKKVTPATPKGSLPAPIPSPEPALHDLLVENFDVFTDIS